MSQTERDQPERAEPPEGDDELSRVDDVLPERECDVVMKGGITSGVIYPLAVCQLATRYRLVNVGGTSAGAIAAAASAAAELGRRRRHEAPGFKAGGYRRVAALPEELGNRLLSLFEAQSSTRPLFRVMVAATRAPAEPPPESATGERGKTFGGKILPLLRASIGARFGWFLAGLATPLAVTALMLWFGRPTGAAAAVVSFVLAALVGLVVGLALVGWSLYRVIARDVPANYFGICTGMGSASALTPWLTGLLDELSGNDQVPGSERHPLTFGDLWGSAAVDRYRELYARSTQGRKPSIGEWAAANALRSINLEMMTTDLSDGRPYRLPTAARGLSFCPKEMRHLFPEVVVSHMIRNSSRTRRKLDDTAEYVNCPEPEHEGEHLYYLPRMHDLPVVIATRMSLSFPVLISAVPLYRVDYLQRGAPAVKCWFSDGGITSNFPVHFFDSLLPRRPTFGINLRTRVPDHPNEDVYLPPAIGQSRRTRWRPMNTIFSFGGMIMDTLQNWSDEGQMTLPGFRDRVVHVALDPQEGGMNLDMPPELIVELSKRGRSAAQLLTGDGTDRTSRFDWDQHRWTRYRTAMAKLEQALEQVAETYDQEGEVGFAHFLQGFRPHHYVGSDVDGWLRFNHEGINQLLDVGRTWLQRPVQYTDYAPEPNPDLRMTARF
ncbi:MAG TPA: hypothetical protein VFR23_01565 [Jiangellaceae bacterium]|nr:hypothetical protein [Jiangellaceae bacterium]